MPRQLSTLQVGAGWFPERAGGLNRYFFDLLGALPGAGVSYRGLVVGSPDVARDTKGRVQAYARADASLVSRWFNARRSAMKAIQSSTDKPDVLVTHFALYAFPLLRMLDLPIVVHFHGPWAAESQREGAGRLSTWAKQLIERSVYRRADRFIVLSGAFRDVLCNNYGVDPAKVRVIPGGVDLPRFRTAAQVTRQEARLRLGWPTDRPIVLSVRRLVARMGLERLIDSMTHVKNQIPDALCIIAGRGRLEKALAARIAAAGLKQHVQLAGFIPDDLLPFAYRAANISIVPSESLEGFGLSAAESLAAGTPPLVSPVGGLPELVAGLNPSLVLGNESGCLPERISTALMNPASIPNNGACLSHASTTFNWSTNVRRIADVYREHRL
ncbi:MAG: glycosyl transferase family 1 [Phycisphaerales bacterium]|nr:glycosyl transferase family 1 [Phycisphaerales bacterium]